VCAADQRSCSEGLVPLAIIEQADARRVRQDPEPLAAATRHERVERAHAERELLVDHGAFEGMGRARLEWKLVQAGR
jgi:hypothetical protein